jgi:CheY-like chemotaxis protein
MTAPLASLTAAAVLGGDSKKKRVLLIDTSRAKRDMRAETMRRLGMEVDCAADISEARCWWRPELYDLVLFHVEREVPHMYKFWDDIRAATPGQQVAFLVGKPAYLASSPNAPVVAQDDDAVATPANGSGYVPKLPRAVPENWGILEACRRISAVRTVADARTRALRDRPLPPRDMAPTETARIVAESEIALEPLALELPREETQ